MSVFERTVSALNAAKHDIVEESASPDVVETNRAVYYVIEGAEFDRNRLPEIFFKAMNSGKNLAIHAPELKNDNVLILRGLQMDKTAEKLGLKMFIADTDLAIERSVDELERGNETQVTRGIGQEAKGSITKWLPWGKK